MSFYRSISYFSCWLERKKYIGIEDSCCETVKSLSLDREITACLSLLPLQRPMVSLRKVAISSPQPMSCETFLKS